MMTKFCDRVNDGYVRPKGEHRKRSRAWGWGLSSPKDISKE